MKWIPLETDAADDPRIAQVVGQFGLEGFGALVMVWCYIGKHGTSGRGEFPNGEPFSVGTFATRVGWPTARMESLLTLCASTGHIDSAAWVRERRVVVPALTKRIANYEKTCASSTARVARWREAHRLLPPATGEVVAEVTAPTPVPAGTATAPEAGGSALALTAPGPRITSDELFERFWNRYPRKTGKIAARKAWDKLKPSIDLCKRMSTTLDRQVHSPEWTKDGGQFIPHPATWLNQGRWDDQPIEVQSHGLNANIEHSIAKLAGFERDVQEAHLGAR